MVQSAPIPENLLVHPCAPVGVGDTVGSLARAYAINTTCVGDYKNTLQGIIDYNDFIKITNESEDVPK